MNKVLKLFLTFFRIGAFTFGGGYAMIPLIQKEVVDNEKWLEEKDILDIIAIAESTPGPIAINSATFVGYKVAGVLGSAAATLGVVLPSYVIILALSFVLDRFGDIEVVKYAFNGIRAGVLALILKALFGMYKSCPKSPFSYILMALSFIAAALASVIGYSTIFVIIGCGVTGIVYSAIAKRRMAK